MFLFLFGLISYIEGSPTKAIMSKATMKAVVFDGPHKVSLQDRPVPEVQAPTDIIVAVSYTALCGS